MTPVYRHDAPPSADTIAAYRARSRLRAAACSTKALEARWGPTFCSRVTDDPANR
jgi:hypothetical protein